MLGPLSISDYPQLINQSSKHDIIVTYKNGK